MTIRTTRRPLVAKCWRCGQRDSTPCTGLPCRQCRAILDAAYDRALAANGGKLLYLPEDWDGLLTVECERCQSEFDVPALGKSSVDRICERCAGEQSRARATAYNRAHGVAAARVRDGLDEIRIDVAGIC